MVKGEGEVERIEDVTADDEVLELQLAAPQSDVHLFLIEMNERREIALEDASDQLLKHEPTD